MTLGTRIYYTGDRANAEGYGMVVGVQRSLYGIYYALDLDDGRTMRQVFDSAFASGPGRRFWAAEEWDAKQRESLAQMQAAAARFQSSHPEFRPQGWGKT